MTTGRVLLTERVRIALIAAAGRSHPIETGGLLLGVRADSTPWVTEAVEIPTDDRGTSHYILPRGATTPAVDTARARDSRIGYIGDWHSHPADVGPSVTDQLAMLRIFHLLTRPAPGPVLVIVRRAIAGYEVRSYVTGLVRMQETTILATGELPPMAERP